ncbi:MAG: C40 family peptidase [Capnocytophaga sp.]|nr:C40 family peptidase [Capnocytophaga sp.]
MKIKKLKIITFVFLTLLLITSCAERYSTRKRTANKGEGREVTTEQVAKNSRKKRKDKKSQKEIVVNTPSEMISEQEAFATKSETTEKTKPNHSSYTVTEKQQLVLDTALSYLGSPYKYGGTTSKGFDCSGFVSAAYKPLEISLHRSSHEMAAQGKNVDIKNVQIGDLLFFVTGKGNRISHVGIVIETQNEVKFIHSSTSRGVIISSLNEGYWSKAYRKARRVM